MLFQLTLINYIILIIILISINIIFFIILILSVLITELRNKLLKKWKTLKKKL